MRRVLEIMKSGDFHKAIDALPGYVASETGKVSGVKDFLERMHSDR